MSGFDPGPGWRELEDGASTFDYDRVLVEYVGTQKRRWVREAPVPPLPTEPYTVIRVERGPEVSQVLVLYGAEWYGVNNPDSLDGITGFEVLAQPVNSQEAIKRVAERAFRDGAEAVLDQIAVQPWAREIDLTKWAEMFGVTS